MTENQTQCFIYKIMPMKIRQAFAFTHLTLYTIVEVISYRKSSYESILVWLTHLQNWHFIYFTKDWPIVYQFWWELCRAIQLYKRSKTQLLSNMTYFYHIWLTRERQVQFTTLSFNIFWCVNTNILYYSFPYLWILGSSNLFCTALLFQVLFKADWWQIPLGTFQL